MNENARLDAAILRRDRKPGFILFDEIDPASRKEWLVKGLLGVAEASAVYGAPGAAKSAMVEDMGLHIAAGRAWHGRDVRQGAVVYLALERAKLVERRALAFKAKHGLSGLPFAIMSGVYDLRTAEAVNTLVTGIRGVEEATGLPVVLVIIDTLSRALCGGDENSPKDMGAIVAALSRLQVETRAHIMAIHHLPQNGEERLRGHGALLGAMDTTIHVEKLASGLRRATVAKANDSEEGESAAFNLETVTIAEDTTAPVVIEADPLDIPATRPKRKVPDRARLALEALTECELSKGIAAPASLELPGEVSRVVKVDDWKAELLSRRVLDPDAPNPRTDFNRVTSQLSARSLIGIRDGFVWPVST